jgi:hypothetical protein
MRPAKTTPQKELIARKACLQKQCRIQEEKLGKDFSYMQEHGGSLLLSSLSRILFPGVKATEKTSLSPATPSLLANYFSIAKELLPVAWEIIRPFLITWCIQRIKHWLKKPENPSVTTK